MKILVFGQLTDIFGDSFVRMRDIPDTDTMVKRLEENYPALKKMKYLIAIDKEIVRENTLLSESCEISLLPPFSGG
ncbi:molybdopterin synthase sulfur carrier subunit [Sinomicrobium oceani]|uniref:Molybdopterin synthase sulfur carrier subunit n=1 Tax=Sinomicrobium oceani TaxID=1150368 RepID=A0A1K1QIN3_9FLAO|nr:MoaD/ThiS family protein [Sinomicrobium oceani]SFW59786.1 molybdopterin synthase sulfur carrier subunit [Sinomicrobium oceani]